MHPIFLEQEKEFDKEFNEWEILNGVRPKIKSFLHLSSLAIAEAVLKMVKEEIKEKKEKVDNEWRHLTENPDHDRHDACQLWHKSEVFSDLTTAIEVIRKEINER